MHDVSLHLKQGLSNKPCIYLTPPLEVCLLSPRRTWRGLQLDKTPEFELRTLFILVSVIMVRISSFFHILYICYEIFEYMIFI